MGNYHARCEAGEKSEVATPETYLSLFGEIPRFTNLLATMRKYNISACCVLQSISQIKKMYKDDWGSIIGNCDALLFLGCAEYETMEFISKKLGKTTITVRNNSISKGGKSSSSMSYQHVARDLLSPDEVGQLNDNESILLIRGVAPFRGDKYEYTKHPNYKYTADADPSRIYKLKLKAKVDESEKVRLKAPIMSYAETAEGRAESEARRNSKPRYNSYNSGSRRSSSSRQMSGTTYQRPVNKTNNGLEQLTNSTFRKQSDANIEDAMQMFAESLSRYQKYDPKMVNNSIRKTRPASLKDVEEVFASSTKIDPENFLINFAESVSYDDEPSLNDMKGKNENVVPISRRSVEEINDSLPTASSSTASF